MSIVFCAEATKIREGDGCWGHWLTCRVCGRACFDWHGRVSSNGYCSLCVDRLRPEFKGRLSYAVPSGALSKAEGGGLSL